MSQAHQGTTVKPEFPKQTISFDIFGGLSPDEEGNCGAYTFIDYFSLGIGLLQRLLQQRQPA